MLLLNRSNEEASEKEFKIRTDPNARINDILKRVFVEFVELD